METLEAKPRHELPESEKFGHDFGSFILSSDKRLMELARVQSYDLDKQAEIADNFRRVLWNYWRFSQATSWMVDFVDRDGAFGMLLTGEYTCLVMVRADGSVSGHS